MNRISTRESILDGLILNTSSSSSVSTWKKSGRTKHIFHEWTLSVPHRSTSGLSYCTLRFTKHKEQGVVMQVLASLAGSWVNRVVGWVMSEVVRLHKYGAVKDRGQAYRIRYNCSPSPALYPPHS